MTKSKRPAASLEGAIGHRFADGWLLARALTHVSALASDEPRSASYQRLEFLGDRVLGLAVASLLHAEYPDASEGELSRRLADLVRRETCAAVARAWDVGPHLRLGGGEARSGGRRKEAILADACEAIIGAVFLDGGFDAAREVVRQGFGGFLVAPTGPLRDPKTALQEWAQSHGWPPPSYEIAGREGPEHAPQFRVVVTVEGEDAFGEGASRRAAEQAAAEAMLARVRAGGFARPVAQHA